MYCGQAPPVERAYIATSYPKGPESSVFNGIVNYECYPGFTMSGTANITCLTDGAWGPRPKCTGNYRLTFESCVCVGGGGGGVGGGVEGI